MIDLLKNKPTERYPEYKDSGVEWLGEIPASWEVVRMRGLFESYKKNVANKAESALLLSLTLRGVVPRLRDGSGKNPTNYDSYQLFEKGDLVFCLFDYDVTPRTIGYVREPGMMTGAYTRLIPKIGISSKYFYYYFLSLDYTKELLHLSTGLRNSLSKPTFWSLKNPLPGIAEQQRIAEYLDEKTKTIDVTIEKKKRLIKLLEEKRASLINRAVTKGLDPSAELVDSGIDWIGKIPKSWKKIKIKTLTQDIQSGVWGEDPRDTIGDVKCLRVADFDYKNLGFKPVNTIRNIPLTKIVQKELSRGDVLIEKSGGGEKTPVGRAIYFNSDEEMVYANFIDRVRVVDGVNPKWFTYVLASAYASKINTKYIKQNTGIQNLDIKNYFSEFIPIPSEREQENIVRYLDQKMLMVDRIAKKVQKSVKLLQEYRSSLISNVVTGKIKI